MMIKVILNSIEILVNSDFLLVIESLENGNDKLTTIDGNFITNVDELEKLIIKQK